MPTSEEVRAAIGKPHALKLKQLGDKIRVKEVLGNRVMVQTVIPFTDLDRVEKEGLLYVPEQVKKDYTPLPSVGMVVQIGDGVEERFREKLEGASIMFSKFAGSDFVVDQEDYKIIAVPEIMCILEIDDPVVPVKGE